ncbi:pyridoxamine 5'-phosphate oxidase-domain-containing protein [Fomes fomentarius]|nr:pyridoxamine 5'-phosphate oxidase-domain-containing protein [Fomes fomentarius]
MWSLPFRLVLALCAIVCVTTVVNSIETVEEAAVLARELVKGAAIGTMATVYPASHATLAGEPFSLQEYYASCHANGSLTLLFLPISRHSQNVLLSPGRSASISVGSDHPSASKPRVSLIGNVTLFPVVEHTPEHNTIQECYLAKHPDARWWLPGPREPHTVYWARFDPHSVYYVGGFGDKHFIGYIPIEKFQAALPADYGEDVAIGGRLLVNQS